MKTIPWRLWRDSLWVFVIALAINTVNIGHTGFYDEFYHVLAAQSWLENGTLQVGDGVYTRAPYFTILIAWVFGVFGESLIVGRMVSAVAGALLVALVFLWTARVANRTAAGIAAFLLCVSPINLFLSQIVRFYALHSLFLWIGVTAVYALVISRNGLSRRLFLAITVIGSFAVALSLQVTTLIGVVGVALWAVPTLYLQTWSSKRITKSHLMLALFVVFMIALASPVFIASDLFAHYWSAFRFAPLWAASSQDSIDFYHWWFLDKYPTLWALLPIAFLTACVTAKRPAIYCAVVFAAVIGLHSLGGTKGGRYIAYALPLFFVLWGIALSRGIPWLSGLTRNAQTLVFGESVSAIVSRVLQVLALSVVLGFIFASNPAFRLTYKMLTLDDHQWPESAPGYRGDPDWGKAAPRLKELAKNASVVVTSAGVKALFYIERLDFDLSETNINESGLEFVIDKRTGGKLISTAEALRLVYDCYPSGLVVIEERHWRNPWAADDSAADFLESQAKRVEVSPHARLVIFTWNHSTDVASIDCSKVGRLGAL